MELEAVPPFPLVVNPSKKTYTPTISESKRIRNVIMNKKGKTQRIVISHVN